MSIRTSVVILAVASLFPRPSVAQGLCESESSSLAAAQLAFQDAASKASETIPTDEQSPAVCAEGKIRWTLKKAAFDVPVVKMIKQDWSTEIPETKMKRKDWSWDQPIIKCENKVVARRPIYKQKGFKITVKWKDIITKVCWPEKQTKSISMDIPEVSMRTKSFSMNVPHFSMDRRELSFKYPEFYMDEGCVGAGCAKICEEVSQRKSAEAEAKLEAATAPARLNLLTASESAFSCQRSALLETQKEVSDNYKKWINIAIATANAMASEGLIEEAAAQNEAVKKMRSDQDKAAAEIDAALKKLDDEQIGLAKSLGAVPE